MIDKAMAFISRSVPEERIELIPKRVYTFFLGLAVLAGLSFTFWINASLQGMSFDLEKGLLLAVLAFSLFTLGYLLVIKHKTLASIAGFAMMSIGVGLLLALVGESRELYESGTQLAILVIIVTACVWVAVFILPDILWGPWPYFFWALSFLGALELSPMVAHAIGASSSPVGIIDWVTIVAITFAIIRHWQNSYISGPISFNGLVDAAAITYVQIGNILFLRKLKLQFKPVIEKQKTNKR